MNKALLTLSGLMAFAAILVGIQAASNQPRLLQEDGKQETTRFKNFATQSENWRESGGRDVVNGPQERSRDNSYRDERFIYQIPQLGPSTSSANPLTPPHNNQPIVFAPYPPTTIFGRGPWIANDKTRMAMQELAAAEGSEETREAKAKLRDALEDEYDDALVAHKKKLDEMENRLEKLRQELEKRREARDELVELRLQTLVYEVEGLPWPTSNSHQGFFDRSFPNVASPAQNILFPTKPQPQSERNP